jgi:hypothetical protein
MQKNILLSVHILYLFFTLYLCSYFYRHLHFYPHWLFIETITVACIGFISYILVNKNIQHAHWFLIVQPCFLVVISIFLTIIFVVGTAPVSHHRTLDRFTAAFFFMAFIAAPNVFEIVSIVKRQRWKS